MISYDQIKRASFKIRQRAKAFHCHQEGEWMAVSTEPGKDDRGVHFGALSIECFSLEDGSQCERNRWAKVCSHVFAANKVRVANAKRRATIARKKAA